jgi:energy-converting hydrogenase Eha subunit H
MNSKGQMIIARFILFLFVFLVFLGLTPIINLGIADSLSNLSCSTDYTIICLIVDAALPLMGVILITMLIGYLKRTR